MAYTIAKLWFLPLYNLWLRKITGKENIPRDKPFIIAANHSSYYDTVLPYSTIIPITNRQIHALVNSRYWDNLFFSFIINFGKCIPVYVEKDIKSEKKNKESMDKALEFLKQGHLIQIFPEGTRSSDAKLKKAYTGIAKLALRAKVPVLPFGIIDSNQVWPKGKSFMRFKRAEVKIGKPLYFQKYYGKENDKKTLEKVTREIMKSIAKLIGQEYKY